MKKILSTIIALFFFTASSFAQSADEKVGEMMNNSQWFELREYLQTENDSVSPFMANFAKAMLAHFFNNPKSAVESSQALIKDFSEDLGIGNILSVSQIIATNQSKLGENTQAAHTLSQILDTTKQFLDSISILSFNNQINRYYELSKFSPYRVSKKFPEVSLPIKLDTAVIIKDKPTNIKVFLTDCEINEKGCDIIFDTGAGMNVISTRLAKEMGLKFLDTQMSAYGLNYVHNIPLAIADSLKLGDITIYDVPFLVLDITSGHETLDAQLSNIEIVIGFEVMNALRHLKLDFKNSCLMLSDKSFVPNNTQPNMMIANGQQLIVKGLVSNNPILMALDTGDGSFGIFFCNSWQFMKSYITPDQKPTDAVFGGSGGFDKVSLYRIKDIPLTIGNNSITIPQIDLSETYSAEDCNVRIGLKTLTLFESVSFDMEQMIMSVVR